VIVKKKKTTKKKKKKKKKKNTSTYGAITPRTSEDLAKPHDCSHPSSSSESCLAEKKN